MKVSIVRGVVGVTEGVHWGASAEGLPLMMVVASGVQVRIEMSVTEAKDHGAAAAYVAISAALTAPPAASDRLRASSSLLGADGLPLEVGA